MTIELAQTLSLVCYVLAVVFFLMGIALFFLLRIPKILGVISGVTAKRAIENIQQVNAQTGDSKFISLQKSVNQTGATGNLPTYNKKSKVAINEMAGVPPVAPVQMVSMAEGSNSGEMNATTKLQQPQAPPAYTPSAYTPPAYPAEGSADTTVLNATPNMMGANMGETTVLSMVEDTSVGFTFDIKAEISFSESQEIIE